MHACCKSLQVPTDSGGMALRRLRELPQSLAKDPDRLLPLVMEEAAGGGSVLIFCGGRGQARSTAGLVAVALAAEQGAPQEERSRRRAALVEELRREAGEAAAAELGPLLLAGTEPFSSLIPYFLMRNRTLGCILTMRQNLFSTPTLKLHRMGCNSKAVQILRLLES